MESNFNGYAPFGCFVLMRP